MPYKDPEQAKAAKKKWDLEHRKGKQRRVWWGYLYEDSAPDDWLEIARESGHEMLAMKHDRDVTVDGEMKEPHWHVVVRFAHAVDKSEAIKLLVPLGVKEQSIQWRDSWTAVARYLVHMDDPNKVQYDPADVIEIGGADYITAINRKADKYRTVAQMQDWVRDNNCNSFSFLMDYARENQMEWFIALCDNSAIIMREYIKSRRYDAIDDCKFQVDKGE